MKTEPEVETLELLNEELKARLARQREASGRVDVKATGALTLVLASVPLGLWNAWSWYIVPARVAILGAATMALGSLAVRSLWEAPVPRQLVEKYSMSCKLDVLEILLGTRVEVFERNARIFHRKARYWRIAAALLAIAAATALLGRWGEQWGN